MTNKASLLRAQLRLIEAEMQRLRLWQTAPPAPTAFNSETPFFADTMDLESWLQWVLLPRFDALLDAGTTLPTSCSIAPMAEHLWKDQANKERVHLLALLQQLDALFD